MENRNSASISERFATGGLLSVDEFAAWAGIGRGKAYKEIKDKNLPIVKIGRRTAVRTQAAKEWAASLSPDGA